MRSHWKRAISILCCLAICATTIAVFTFPVGATGEYFSMTENNRNLFINVNQEIELVDVSVVVNGETLAGNDVSWSCTDNEHVSIANGILKVNTAGLYKLTVEDASENQANVTVIAKEASATEYVLYEENFDSVADGTLPENWKLTENLDITADPAKQHTTYVASPQVKGGKLYVGNGVANSASSVLLPAFLDSFADYAVDMDFKQSYTMDNMRYSGIVVRAQRSAENALENGYFEMFRRSSRTAGGLEIFTLAKASDTGKTAADNEYPNAVGSTQNFGASVDYQREAYDMHGTFAVSGKTMTMDLYRTGEQTQFEGDPWSVGNGLKGTVPSPALSVSIGDGWTHQLETGGIAIRTVGSQLTVDNLRVTVPVALLASNPDYYVPSSEQQGDSASFTDMKLGIVSDVHLQDGVTGADKNLKAMLTKYKNEGMDAVLILGDVANSALDSQYAKFNQIWDSVFTDPETAPKKLAIMGNHEFENAYYNRETVAQAQQRYMDAYGYDTLNFNVKVGDVHVIGINSETAAVDGGYTATPTDWLKTQLDAAKEEDPYQPIIVMCHQTLANTTYGSAWGSSKTAALYEVLKNYPQVIYLAGHSHYPTENERCIMQDAFTCIDCTSLQYVSLETGTPADAFSAQGALSMVLDAASKKLTVNRLRMDGDSVRTAKDPWVLTLPLSKKTFTYTATRKDDRVAPTFASSAEVSTSKITATGCTVSFPSATHSDYVQGYNVTVREKGGSSTPVLTKYFVSDFYVSLTNMKAQQSTEITGLAPNTDYVISVTAVESFGLESEPLTKEISTLPITEPSAAYNRADFMDVDFTGGFDDNSPYRRVHTLYGSANASKLIQSDEINRQVLDANGWINYPTTHGSLLKITDSFSMEVAFREPAELIKSQCLFGNPQSGGISLETNAAGTLQMGINIGGSWKYAQAPALQPNTWYHVLVTFDSAHITMYLNGTQVAQTAVTGGVNYNKSMNWMTIAANSDTSGNASNKFVGQMALARIYTDCLTAAKAADAYAFYQKDDSYSAIYNKVKTLMALDPAELKAEDQTTVTNLITQGNALLTNPAMTAQAATDYLADAQEQLDALAAANPSINWSQFRDDCSSFALLNDKTSSWQIENNKELNKQIFTKNNNIDSTLIYQLPGNIRNFEVDALLYAGFGDANRDFAFYVSEDGETWKQLKFNATEPVDDPAYESGAAVAWLDTTASAVGNIGGTYDWFKIVMKKFDNGVTWSAGIDDVRIAYTEKTDDVPVDNNVFVPEVVQFTDPYDNMDLISKASDNLQNYVPHPESGLNVLGRNGLVGDSSVQYTKKGYLISDFSLKLQYAPEFAVLADNLKISVRTINTNTWTDVTVQATAPEAIPGSSTETFQSTTITPAAALPANIAEIKITMNNDPIWTVFLDGLNLTYQATDLPDDPEEEESGPEKPTFTANFTDPMENLDLTTGHSDNWELFAPHPETDLTVAGKTNGKRGTLNYMSAGKTIDDFAIKLQVAPAFFDPDSHLLISVRKAGSDKFEPVEIKADFMKKVNGSFSTVWIQPDAALGDDIEEIQITLYNDVAWTLMVDEVNINYVGEGGSEGGSSEGGGSEGGGSVGGGSEGGGSVGGNTSTGGTSEGNVNTGISGTALPGALLLGLSGLGVLIGLKRKKNED